MRSFLLFTIVLFIFCQNDYAQERTKAVFDVKEICKDAADKGNSALAELTTATNCTLPDLEGALSYFRPGAYIEVSTLRTPELIRLTPKEYALGLNALHCSSQRRYKTMKFLFDDIDPADVQVLQKGDTIWAIAPVRQLFIGRAVPGQSDYSDITFKNIVSCYYFDENEILHGDIDHVDAVKTLPYHPGRRLRG